MDEMNVGEVMNAAYNVSLVAAQIERHCTLRRRTAAQPLQHWSGAYAETFARQAERQYREGQAIVDVLRTIARRANSTVMR